MTMYSLIAMVIVTALIALFSFFLGITFTDCAIDIKQLEKNKKFDSELIAAYAQYKKGAEELLGILEEETGWHNRFDVKDYYEGLHRVDSLCATKQ